MAAAYTETEINEIALWLREGLSASGIAARFSTLRGARVSRNAIIGIVHRNSGLRAIGFANPKGGRAGGRPRKTARPLPQGRGKMAAGAATADLPPILPPETGGDARQGRGGRCPASVSAFPTDLSACPADASTHAVAAETTPTITARTPLKPKPRKPARALPPAWLAPVGVAREKSEAQRYKLPAPRPPKPPGRQHHVAAMRFIDCLFDRCRAPLDLALRDPEDDPSGARPGPDMLCCGLRTSPTRSYCAHHHARFHGRRMGAL